MGEAPDRGAPVTRARRCIAQPASSASRRRQRTRMRPIEETIVLITGATDGLGRGVAERLAADGATVHLHGRDPERLAATAAEIQGNTGNERLVTHLADLA